MDGGEVGDGLAAGRVEDERPLGEPRRMVAAGNGRGYPLLHLVAAAAYVDHRRRVLADGARTGLGGERGRGKRERGEAEGEGLAGWLHRQPFSRKR